MPTMVETIRALCKEAGVPISKIEKELGYGNGYLNPKKIEVVPADRLVEIANYLQVPVFRITAQANTKSPPPDDGGGLVGDLLSLDAETRGLLFKIKADNTVRFDFRGSVTERKAQLLQRNYSPRTDSGPSYVKSSGGSGCLWMILGVVLFVLILYWIGRGL